MATTTTETQLLSGAWDVETQRTTATFTVRHWGFTHVHGTIRVDAGQVTIADGAPVGATAVLEAASVSTGIKKRDIDLTGRRFFATAEHPEIRVTVQDVQPADGAWTAQAVIAVAGGEAPLALVIRRESDPDDDGAVRVVATGVLDRSQTPIRAPRLLIGRWITVEVDATLRRRP